MSQEKKLKKVETDFNYNEGKWLSAGMVRMMAKTSYGTIEAAIEAKEVLIKQFESQFGYSREMEVAVFDPNYSRNLGILDGLKEQQALILGKNGTE